MLCLCLAELTSLLQGNLICSWNLSIFFPSSPREAYWCLLSLPLLHLTEGAVEALLCWQMSKLPPREVDVCNIECDAVRFWSRNPEWCSGHSERKRVGRDPERSCSSFAVTQIRINFTYVYLTHVFTSLFLNSFGDKNFLDFPAVYSVASHSLPLKAFPEVWSSVWQLKPVAYLWYIHFFTPLILFDNILWTLPQWFVFLLKK